MAWPIKGISQDAEPIDAGGTILRDLGLWRCVHNSVAPWRGVLCPLEYLLSSVCKSFLVRDSKMHIVCPNLTPDVCTVGCRYLVLKSKAGSSKDVR